MGFSISVISTSAFEKFSRELIFMLKHRVKSHHGKNLYLPQVAGSFVTSRVMHFCASENRPITLRRFYLRWPRTLGSTRFRPNVRENLQKRASDRAWFRKHLHEQPLDTGKWTCKHLFRAVWHLFFDLETLKTGLKKRSENARRPRPRGPT